MAGSESAKRTGFEPTDPRFIELKEINGSLSVLGRCIESRRNQSPAPWREMMLTKILWQYLRGDGYVSMIVTAHICDDDYNETMRALEFGAKYRNIKMRAIVNSVRPPRRHSEFPRNQLHLRVKNLQHVLEGNEVDSREFESLNDAEQKENESNGRIDAFLERKYGPLKAEVDKKLAYMQRRMDEKDKLLADYKMENQALKAKLRCSNAPSPSKREPMCSNNSSSSSSSHRRSNRKRPRDEMESGHIGSNESNPTKKRKITTNIPSNSSDSVIVIDDDDDEDDEDMVLEGMDSTISYLDNTQQQSTHHSSLQPQNLLNEYNESSTNMTPVNEEEEIDDDDNTQIAQITSPKKSRKRPSSKVKEEQKEKIESTPSNKKRFSNLVSPAPSHLSEGDDPLPKVGNNRIRKAMKKSNKPKLTYNKKVKQKKYPLMRTPAIKEKTRRFTQKYDVSQPTPTTKSGLNALRVVDLKKKLKKHSLKAYGKKSELVNTLYAHKKREESVEEDTDSNHNKNDGEDQSEECGEVREIDFKWIGDAIKESDGKIYYGGIKIAGIVYTIGQECYVKNENEDGELEELWMAQIVELYQKNNECFMSNAWFWKYAEIRKALKKNKNVLSADENELFLSSGHLPDENHIALLEPATFKVFASKSEMEENAAENIGEISMQTYFSQYTFNTKQKKIFLRMPNEEERSKKMKIKPIREEIEEDMMDESENEIKVKNKKKSKKSKKSRAKSSASAYDENVNNNEKVNGRRRGRRKRHKTSK